MSSYNLVDRNSTPVWAFEDTRNCDGMIASTKMCHTSNDIEGIKLGSIIECTALSMLHTYFLSFNPNPRGFIVFNGIVQELELEMTMYTIHIPGSTECL